MKKIILGTFALVSAAAIFLSVNTDETSNMKNELMQKNIEALSAGENSSTCIGDRFKVTPISGGWHCANNQGNSCCPII